MKLSFLVFLALALAIVFFSTRARADATEEAATAYQQGLDAAKSQQWGDALAAFERSYAANPHALAAYNMGIAESSLSRLTRARDDFSRALDLDEKSGHKQLAQSFVDETSGQMRDIDARLVHLHVTIEPSGASVTVDGRPLTLDPNGQGKIFIAGIAASSATPPQLPDAFDVVVDPGKRDIVIQKEGFAPATSNEVYAPGSHADLKLSLTAREATIHVDAERKGAVVRLQGLDVGVAPLTLKRPPGSYALDVRAVGYVTYETAMQLTPGANVDFFARMPPEPFVITKKWWFWAGMGAVVAGAATTVFLLTRSHPYDGGSTGWVAEAH